MTGIPRPLPDSSPDDKSLITVSSAVDDQDLSAESVQRRYLLGKFPVVTKTSADHHADSGTLILDNCGQGTSAIT